MSQSRYSKGRQAEYRARKWWEREGAFVVRAAASKGVADLVAIKNGQAFLIQVKVNNSPTKSELRKLNEIASKCGAFAVVMVWQQKHRKWKIDIYSEGELIHGI